MADTPARLFDATSAEPHDTAPKSLIPVQDIVRAMSLSASTKRCLVIDTAGSQEGILREAGVRFGNRPIQVLDHQWVILNRSQRMSGQETTSGGRTTRFMQSVLDGMAWHADSDRDNEVSLLEFSDYVRDVALAEQTTPPRLLGKATDDFVLVSSTATPDDARSLPEAQRHRLANTLLQPAMPALFVEQNVEAALQLLNRAAEYGGNQETHERIDSLFDTALASKGDVRLALQRAKLNSRPLFLLVRDRVPIHTPGSKTGRTRRFAESGMTLKATTVSDDGKFVWVVQGYSPRPDGNQVVFRPASVQKGWVWIDDLVEPQTDPTQLAEALGQLPRFQPSGRGQ